MKAKTNPRITDSVAIITEMRDARDGAFKLLRSRIDALDISEDNRKEVTDIVLLAIKMSTDRNGPIY